MNELYQSAHKTCLFDGGNAMPERNNASENAVKNSEMITDDSPVTNRAERLPPGGGTWPDEPARSRDIVFDGMDAMSYTAAVHGDGVELTLLGAEGAADTSVVAYLLDRRTSVLVAALYEGLLLVGNRQQDQLGHQREQDNGNTIISHPAVDQSHDKSKRDCDQVNNKIQFLALIPYYLDQKTFFRACARLGGAARPS